MTSPSQTNTSAAGVPRRREEITRSTAAALRDNFDLIAQTPVMVGFDGFVDEIIGVVERRTSSRDYSLVETIARFAAKIADNAGRSGNYELVVKQQKLGGNGPIMANAFARMGLKVTYVGNLGWPDIHPIFSDFARQADVRSIAPPAHTDALEFADGKLMLGKLEPLAEVNWETINARLGTGELRRLVNQSRVIGMVNWTMLTDMSRIWAKLINDVFPDITPADEAQRHVFIDLADPEKRTRDDIRYAVKLLGRMQEFATVTLGCNLAEATQVARVLDIPVPTDAESAIEALATQIREALNLSCCVVHPRAGAAAATADSSATFAGPFVHEPRISTGAGDHFNAGFMLGRLLGRPVDECLCTGVATSGYYVRTAESPSAAQLADFISALPDPE